MKTAIEQVIETLEHIKNNKCKHVYEVVFFDGVLAVIEAGGFLECEKQQLIDSYKSGVSGTKLAEDYYNETFNKS